MKWIEKDQPSPFDNESLCGFFMLDGDMLFALTRKDEYKGVKRPMIEFPSGVNRALWPSRKPEHVAEVYLFGELALPVRGSRDEAFDQAVSISTLYGYGVRKVGDQELEVWDERDYDHFRVIYDTELAQIVNIVPVRTTPFPVSSR